LVDARCAVVKHEPQQQAEHASDNRICFHTQSVISYC